MRWALYSTSSWLIRMSAGAIAQYTSFTAPVALKLLFGKKRFYPGKHIILPPFFLKQGTLLLTVGYEYQY